MKKLLLIWTILLSTLNGYGQEYNSAIVRNILKSNHIKSIECKIVSYLYISDLNIRFCYDKSVFEIVTLRRDSTGKINSIKITPHHNIDLCNYIITSINDFFIAKKVKIYKYMKKENYVVDSDPSPTELKITINSHGKNNIIYSYMGDGYTNGYNSIGNKTVKYSIPFRKFIQTIDRYIPEEVGGEQLELYNHIIDSVRLDKDFKIIPNAVFDIRENP